MSQLLTSPATQAPSLSNSVTFNCIQQFVVVPDRHYRVEFDGRAFHFFKTGSEFDAQWAARGATNLLGPKIGAWIERVSPQKLLWTGILVATIAALLLAYIGVSIATTDSALGTRKLGIGIGVITFTFVFGLVMIIAGISGRRDKKAGDRDCFTLHLTELAAAKLLPVQSELARRGEPQVARVEVPRISGKPLKLSIPTEEDLASARIAFPGLS